MNKKGMLVILSAPSGCGKDTVFKALCKRRNDIVESVSATTRAPRDGEVDGVNYYFKTVGELLITDFWNMQSTITVITAHLLTAFKTQLMQARFVF